MRLSDYAVGKDNNFTLLRLIAAASVVFTHSVAVLGLPWIPDVFLSRFGRTYGEVALDMLFVTSGFLVTASLLLRPNLIEFYWARLLRLYPGLWVMLLVTTIGLAPFVTTLPFTQFFTSHQTWEYLWKCSTLFSRHPFLAPRRVRRHAAQGRVQRLALDASGRIAHVRLPRRDVARVRASRRNSG